MPVPVRCVSEARTSAGIPYGFRAVSQASRLRSAADASRASFQAATFKYQFPLLDGWEVGGVAKSPEDVSKIKESFSARYAGTSPFNEYIIGVGVSKLRIALEDDQRETLPAQSLDDLCLMVMLHKEPQIALGLPESYEGVRVIYRVTGCIECQ